MRGEHFCSRLSIVQASLTMLLVGRGLPCEELIIHSCFTYFEGCGAAFGSPYLMSEICTLHSSSKVVDQRGQKVSLIPEETVLQATHLLLLTFRASTALGSPSSRGTWLDQGATATMWPVRWNFGCFWTDTEGLWKVMRGKILPSFGSLPRCLCLTDSPDSLMKMRKHFQCVLCLGCYGILAQGVISQQCQCPASSGGLFSCHLTRWPKGVTLWQCCKVCLSMKYSETTDGVSKIVKLPQEPLMPGQQCWWAWGLQWMCVHPPGIQSQAASNCGAHAEHSRDSCPLLLLNH